MQPVIKQVELGLFDEALKLLEKKLKGVTKEQIKELKQAIIDTANTHATESLEVASNSEKTSSERYDALLKLTALKSSATKVSSVKTSAKSVTTLLKESGLKKEALAHKAYDIAFLKLDSVWAKSKFKHKSYTSAKTLTIKQLETITKKYPETKFGKLAKADIENMTSE